jgi:sugar phosphate isomerase/epimerase
MWSRREFARVALGMVVMPLSRKSRAAHLAAQIETNDGWSQVVNGVRLGVQTYSFRNLPRTPGGDAIAPVVKAMTECGLNECELYAPQVEPNFSGGDRRARLRAWRVDTPLNHFREVKKKFEAASITVYAYNYSFQTDFTDAEVDRGFDVAKALGATIVTASTTLDMAKRLVPFAERHRMIVAMHGHSDVEHPNEFASPESFLAALAMSKYFKVNLDIGHFTAANYDAVAFIEKHHEDITNLHLKDRKRNQGENVPWGAGDTPVREVLRLLKREHWPIRAYIEYEYEGAGSPVEEVKKCYAYAKAALA